MTWNRQHNNFSTQRRHITPSWKWQAQNLALFLLLVYLVFAGWSSSCLCLLWSPLTLKLAAVLARKKSEYMTLSHHQNRQNGPFFLHGTEQNSLFAFDVSYNSTNREQHWEQRKLPGFQHVLSSLIVISAGNQHQSVKDQPTKTLLALMQIMDANWRQEITSVKEVHDVWGTSFILWMKPNNCVICSESFPSLVTVDKAPFRLRGICPSCY